jgi:hypothetical protein
MATDGPELIDVHTHPSESVDYFFR